jgi:hypothetical protein
LVSDGRTSPPMLRIARVLVDMNSFRHASILRRGYPGGPYPCGLNLRL